MRFPDSAGLHLSIVDGFVENEEIIIQCIDNYHYPFRDFVGMAKKKDLISFDLDDCMQVPRLYIIAGHPAKVSRTEQVWRKRIKQAFDDLLQSDNILKKINRNLNETEYYCLESFYWLYLSEVITSDKVCFPLVRGFKPFEDDLDVLVFYMDHHPSEHSLEMIEKTIAFWLDREQPTLKGYQCLTRSFILRNMVGRKILSTFPDKDGSWGMLLEGGIFLPLADDFDVGLSKLNSKHIGQWTVGEIEEILLNPIYAYGYYYQHIDLICEWFYVFLYSLVTINEEELKNIKLEILYRDYCEYLGRHICPYKLIEQKNIEVNQSIAVFNKKLGSLREYLKGEEEIGVSKNILLMMRNRNAYLPAVHRFIHKNTGLVVDHMNDTIPWNNDSWKYALSQLETVSCSYEKGTKLEELAQYFIRTIPGIKITDVRSRKGRAEVDIYCCNVSYDSSLWKLGALILVECKNRETKVVVSDIRNLVATMEAKGIIGAMFFSRAGFTSVAEKEIKHQLSGGKMIIPICLSELKGIDENDGAYGLVRRKIEQFEHTMEDKTEQLYF
ncbi:restriction endonuclease [Paenibacillus sp. KS-LC4]|uniref:restriction endonuclease n=1 Tax=Paenibacillus sp. KS-LC4 TaxID=2979727 RepID=UPI0030D549D5